jgi:hypothetical protein
MCDDESDTVDVDEFPDVREEVEGGAPRSVELEDEEGVELALTGGPEDPLEAGAVVAGPGPGLLDV